MDNIKILIYYINISDIVDSEVRDYMNKISKVISSSSINENNEIIFIPVYSETRIDCINPKYITNSDLIKKHERLMSELNEKLTDQLNSK